MNNKILLLAALAVLFINSCTAKSVVNKAEKKSQADIDKEVLLEDPDDYPDDDVLDLTPEEQKARLHKLVEGKIDENKDGLVSADELYHWTLRAYDRFEVDDLRDEIQIVDEDKDGDVSWKEHAGDTFGAECAEKDDCFTDPESDEEKLNRFNYLKDKRLFNAADANNDQQLDFDEYVVFKHPRRSEATSLVVIDSKMEQLDLDKDGGLSVEEFLSESKEATTDEAQHKLEEERFRDELDRDGNGKLDHTEVLDWLEPNNEAEAQDETDHLLEECDANDDKQLTVDEILSNHAIWVDSDATDYGRYLMDHDEL